MEGVPCRGAGGKLRRCRAVLRRLFREAGVNGAGMVELCWGGSLIQRWGVNVSVESHFSLFAPETGEFNSNLFGQNGGKTMFPLVISEMKTSNSVTDRLFHSQYNAPALITMVTVMPGLTSNL